MESSCSSILEKSIATACIWVFSCIPCSQAYWCFLDIRCIYQCVCIWVHETLVGVGDLSVTISRYLSVLMNSLQLLLSLLFIVLNVILFLAFFHPSFYCTCLALGLNVISDKHNCHIYRFIVILTILSSKNKYSLISIPTNRFEKSFTGNLVYSRVFVKILLCREEILFCYRLLTCRLIRNLTSDIIPVYNTVTIATYSPPFNFFFFLYL